MTTSMITVFLLSMAGAWFGRAVPSRSLNSWDKNKPNLLGFLFCGVIMILFVGLRANQGDTYQYIYMFQLREEAGNPMPTIEDSSFLFQYLQYLIQKFGGDKQTLIMITALITLVPVLLVFRKYAPDFTLAVFFYFTTGIYVATMNGIRQFVAAGILLLATRFLFSPKKYDFFGLLIIVAIAYFFHSSALFMIPVYFVCRRRAWSLSTFMIIIGGVAALIFVSLFLPEFLDMLEGGSYEQYGDGWFTEGVEQGASFLRVGFQSIPMILSAIYYKKIRHYGPAVDILVNLSVVHFAIFMLSLYNWIFARFAYYTYTYMCILLALIFSTVIKERKQQFFKILLYAAYIFFFFNETSGLSLYRSEFFEANNTVWF